MGAPYQYVVLHQSCAKRIGVACAQAIHAATEAIQALPVDPETHVVVLVAEKSEDLERIAAELDLAGIVAAVIREPDAPYFGAATAVGVEPMNRDVIKPLLAGFSILREPEPEP